ncbi:hypothetical protein DPMN_131353 [Dreissena polymorpha]|uniref:Uncharacterized protein n=1 Tax=Dreissena polymorpha TaxID=45954 RepID=A0A9D4K1Y3_DREPO|nr:hypothetical protein DPMN_131353 [Dreissena polymorpha]
MGVFRLGTSFQALEASVGEKQALRDRSPRPNVFVLSGTIGSKNTKTAIASPPGEMLGRNQAADSGHCPVYRLDPSSALFDPRDGPGVRLKGHQLHQRDSRARRMRAFALPHPRGPGVYEHHLDQRDRRPSRKRAFALPPPPGPGGLRPKGYHPRSAGPSDESKKSVRAPPPPGARGSTSTGTPPRSAGPSGESKKSVRAPPPRGPGGLRRAKSKRIPLRSAGPSAESKKSVRAPPPPGPGGLRPKGHHLDQRDRRGESKKSVRAPPTRGPGGLRTPPRSAGPSGESRKSVRAPPPPGPGGLRPQEDHLDQRGPSGESKKSVRPSPPPGPGGLRKTTSISGTVGRVEKERSPIPYPGARGSTSERTPPRSAGPSGESNKSVRAPPSRTHPPPGPWGLRLPRP